MHYLIAGSLIVLAGIPVMADNPPIEPLPRTPIVEQAEPAVFVHVMTSFRTKEFSGTWRGWNQSNQHVQNDPEQKDERGLPQIASVFHPAIGPYDQNDPHLVEYHCQLVKMAQLDGFFFDVGFFHGPQDEQEEHWVANSMREYIKAMQRYDLKGAIVYEEKYHWIFNPHIVEREEAVRRAKADVDAWIDLFEPVQWYIGDRPLVTFFSFQHILEDKGISRLTPEEMLAWRQDMDPQPITMTQWLPPHYHEVHEGWKTWIQQSRDVPEGSELRAYADEDVLHELLGDRYRDIRRRMNNGHIDIAIPAVWPGFDDRRVHGWGQGPRFTPHEDGKTYELTWNYALASEMPVIQVATWNDWFEGTIIEPSVENGTRYLNMTRHFAARHKREAVNDANLELPVWIYRLRKRAKEDAEALAAADRSSELIARSQFGEAETVVEPWVDRYALTGYDFEASPDDK